VIPQADIEIQVDVNLDLLRAPGRGTVEYPSWLGTQRDYNPEFYDEATWELAEEALAEERRALRQVDAQAGSEGEFDELAFEEFDAEAPLMGYLELGVSALCIALNTAGLVTASSCRGHAESARDLPQLLLACDRQRAKILMLLAEQAGCGLENFEATGLALYAASIADFLELAEAVLAERSRFESLPAGPERREGSEEPWS
jgi:hypothetical protein